MVQTSLIEHFRLFYFQCAILPPKNRLSIRQLSPLSNLLKINNSEQEGQLTLVCLIEEVIRNTLTGPSSNFIQMQSSRRLKHQVQHQKECRICLAQGGRDLIAPCACRGSSEFVHIDCLNQYLHHKPKPEEEGKQSIQAIKCQICKKPYVGIDSVEDIRCLSCSEILNLPQRKKSLVLSFLIGNGLIAAALFGGVVIFIGGEDVRMLLGAIWYAIVIILGTILWMCLWKKFEEYVHVVEKRLVRTMQPPLTLKLRPFANPEKADPRFRPMRRRLKK